MFVKTKSLRTQFLQSPWISRTNKSLDLFLLWAQVPTFKDPCPLTGAVVPRLPPAGHDSLRRAPFKPTLCSLYLGVGKSYQSPAFFTQLWTTPVEKSLCLFWQLWKYLYSCDFQFLTPEHSNRLHRTWLHSSTQKQDVTFCKVTLSSTMISIISQLPWQLYHI